MTLKVLFISLTGILVVFAFLFLLYLILYSFKHFFYNKKSVNNQLDYQKVDKKKLNLSQDGKLSREEITAVLTALSHHHNQDFQGDQITINKRR